MAREMLTINQTQTTIYRVYIMNKLTKGLFAGAMLMGAASSAYATPLEFTIDNTLGVQDQVDGVERQFNATGISGQYEEVIVVTDAATGAFDATILLTFTSFGIFDLTGLQVDYGLYAQVNVSGNVISSNLPTSITTGNWTGDFELVLDVERDSNTFVPAAVGDGELNLSALELDDDITLFTGDIVSGGSTGSTSNGGFDLLGEIELTDAGEDFFIAPNPFFNFLFSTGDLEDFFTQVDFTAENVIQRFDGEADIEFVPEPNAVFLLGLGLFGLALRARRK